MSELKIIDAWMQHPTRYFLEQPMFASLRRWNKTEAPAVDVPLEWTIRSMDQAQVSKGLLCSWHSPLGVLISNEAVAACIEQYPDRFVGIASVPLNRPMDALAELKHCVKDLGFKGLRIIQWLWNLPPTHAYYYPLFAACVEMDIPVCFQVGHTGPLMPSEVGRPIPYIDQVAIDFPGLRIVGGHIGYPWTTEMIAVATKHQNVYIDTSAYTAKRYPKELVEYIKHHGQDKVLFGSNYPMITASKCLEGLDALGLNPEVSRKFLCDNAQAVFKL